MKPAIDISEVTICRRCGTKITEFTKHIGYGPTMGKVYHYLAHCPRGHNYHVKRTQEVYHKVKDQQWIYSKTYKKHTENDYFEQKKLFDLQDQHLKEIRKN